MDVQTGNPNTFDGERVEAFKIESLNEQERKQAQEIGEITNALLLKALLHRFDSALYPLPSNSSSPEAIIFQEVVKNISPTDFKLMRPRLSPERLKSKKLIPKKLKRTLGSLSNIDFTKTDLMPYFETMSLKPQQQEPRRSILPIPPATPLQPPSGTPQGQVNYRSLDLVLRALYCVDETDPEDGTDDMILGGVKVEANGGTGGINSFICGVYADNQIHRFGYTPLARYDLTTITAYPQSVYAIIQLVESDSDDRDVAKALTNLTSTVASIVAGFFLAGAGAIVGGIISAIGAFIEVFLDDDYFPPFGIMGRLNSATPFGSQSWHDEETEDINAHDGTYRIRYTWILNA